MRAVLALALLSLGSGCRTETVLGPPSQGPRDSGPAPFDRMSRDAEPACVMQTETQAEWEAADWSGYSDANSPFWPSESALARVVLPTDSGGGWIVFGNSKRLPEPTPEDLCYPACDFSDSITAQPPRWHPGVKYPLRLKGQISPTGTRVATVPLHEPWREWCRLQTPVPVGPDEYSCSHKPGEGPNDDACRPSDGGVESPAECCHIQLCQRLSVCECTAAGCVVSGETAELKLFEWDDRLVVLLDDFTAVEMQPVKAPATAPSAMDAGEPPPPPMASDASTLLDVQLGLPVPPPNAIDASLDADPEGADADPQLPDPADGATDADAASSPPMDAGMAADAEEP